MLQKSNLKNIFRGKNLVIFILGLLVIGLAGVVLYQNVVPQIEHRTLSGQEVASRAVEYINSQLLQGKVKAEATGKPEKVENCLYKFGVKVGTQKFESYATVSGTLLFPAGYEIAPKKVDSGKQEVVSKKVNSSSQKDTAKECAALGKSNQPTLEAFVVSYCPFGLQMQRILTEIVKNIPQLKNYIKIRYIGAVVDGKVRSMHGDKEATENLRQVCIREEQSGKFFDYLGCFIQQGNSEKCLESAKIDSAKLAQCMSDKNRGIKYIEKDFDEQGKYKIAGSPTLVLNKNVVSEFKFGGRTAEAVKTLLCCGFNNQPSFCSGKLSNERAATGFSTSYSSKGSSSGRCN